MSKNVPTAINGTKVNFVGAEFKRFTKIGQPIFIFSFTVAGSDQIQTVETSAGRFAGRTFMRHVETECVFLSKVINGKEYVLSIL